jgi:hypothetical protein
MTEERLKTDDLVQQDADAPVGRDDSEGDQRTEDLEPLFDKQQANELRDRWYALQARFVDDPRETVQEADSLVAELLQELARGFSEARSNLEQQWSGGGDASTEDLRLTLQRYRSFFERMLAA